MPSRLTATLALLDRNPANALNAGALDAALSAIAASQDRSQQLEAIRLVIRALGDYRVENPTLEVYAPYQPAVSLQGLQPLVTRIQHTLREIFPTPDPDVNREAARLLAFVEDDAPSTPVATLGLITAQSPPTDDFHYLAVLARLTGPLPSNGIPRLANAILSLDRKWQGRQNRDLLQWKDRLPEVVQPLLRREPSLAVALLKDPNFVSPSHVLLASLFGAAHYQTAARQFLAEDETQSELRLDGAAGGYAGGVAGLGSPSAVAPAMVQSRPA